MISKKHFENEFLSKLTILPDPEFISIARIFVLNYAKFFNFTEEELNKIELMVEEALISIIKNLLKDETPEPIEIKISYLPGEFIVAIHDKGIPVDINMLESSEDTFLSVLLLKNIADKFKLINLGKDGKKIELVKFVNSDNITDLVDNETVNEDTTPGVSADDIGKIKLLNSDEALQLSRLAFKTYGYTYVSDFYYPEKLKEMVERKYLVSAVCKNSNEEIIGNLSLMFEEPEAKVADSGAAMVDHRYRGHNLFKKMKEFLSKYATDTGMYGIYSEAVTIHPYTQKGNVSLGAKVTGIMLAFVKENINFKKISDNKNIDQRQAVVLYYLKTTQEPHRTVFINKKFHSIVKSIYDNLNFNRELVSVLSSDIAQPELDESVFSALVKSGLNIAVIKFKTIGKNAYFTIKKLLKNYCLRKIESIYLELPLSDPYSAILVEKVNTLGFMFSGVLPELNKGDYIAMQYLNNVKVDPEKIKLVSPLATEILNIIMKDYS